MRESEFINSIKKIGGSVYIVGGWVRDRIRGVCPKDRDYVLCGLREEDFLGAFPSALRTGRAFPVYRLELDGEVCEIAFARTERKEGSGYRGFAVAFSPDVTIEDDLWRRDTTMNSIAYSPLDGSYVDPFGGADDIGARTIRATSRHFLDDPVRALRAARQAAQLEFGIEPGTIAMMGECRGEIAAEPPERLVRELESALGASRPSLFFRALKDASLLDAVFPEIAALIGKTQPPCYHPEGDAFEHTMMAVDCCASLTERIEARFAALAHDLGKGLTPEGMLPRHQGHDKVGLDALKAWNNRMMLPARWLKCAGFAISEHMRALDIERPKQIVDLLLRLSANPLGFDGFCAVIRADNKTPPKFLTEHERYLEAINAVRGNDAPAGLKGPGVGRWIMERRILAVKKLINLEEEEHGR